VSIRRYTISALAEDGGDSGDTVSKELAALLEAAGAHVETISSEEYDGDELDDDDDDGGELADDIADERDAVERERDELEGDGG
jgi:hypothetical protein